MKLKNGLVKENRERREFNKKQAQLKEKHKIPGNNEEIVIVEKNNFIKFFIRSGVGMFQLAAKVVLIILAVIGLAALIYPVPRNDLVFIFKDILVQLKSFF